MNEVMNKAGLDIVIHVMGMPFNGRTVRERSLGGSESAGYYLARELAGRGHRVKVFTMLDAPDETVDGVTYVFAGQPSQQAPLGERFDYYAANTPHDVLIIQRLPHAFHKRWAAKVCIWQLHDLALMRSAQQMLGGMWQVDAVTTVSDWHRQQVQKVWNVNPDVLHVVPNGVDPALYESRAGDVPRVVFGDKVGRLDAMYEGRPTVGLPSGRAILLYQSRPERGLEHLVRAGGIMERLKAHPVHLVVCGYDNTVPQMAGYYNQLYTQGAALGNVTFMGALPKPVLAELQRKSDVLVYPTEFEEVSCITAMEAMHAGLPMLTSECAALPETCAASGTVLFPLKDGAADEDAFVERLAAWFPEGDLQLNPALTSLRKAQHDAALSRTWANATSELEGVISQALFAKLSTAAVLRSAVERSDIMFARWVFDRYVTDPDDANPIIRKTRDELARLYAFTASDDAYAAHYAKHQTRYYDEFEDRVIGEDVTGTTRFQGVAHFLAQACRERSVKRILDYGCAHGHYMIPLAKMFPHLEFIGIDISARAVQAARKWAVRDAVENVRFEQRIPDVSLASGLPYDVDVVIAGEVLEHVPDPLKLLEEFQAVLEPGGVIVATTPCGRWEHSGTEEFRTGREHLHHFERADLVDIAGKNPIEILHAPAGHDRAGFELGSWVWCLDVSRPFGKIDYERKLARYAPRETISACMIVKDAEKSIRRTVESFIDWVDEVILVIDPTTKDRTNDVCALLALDFPNRPITYFRGTKSACVDGFDEARNESIEGAVGDWILWIDADEELRNPWALHRLARHSQHNGYGFPQVHYSVDPGQVLTTDYPCRLFRNRIGVKFYGLVHEHPETELGKAVPWSLIRPDAKFLHHGYYDEETRRKRFARNLPLLIRDLDKHPERVLNKFLYLRDLAQSIAFQAEQTGGAVLPDSTEKAHAGIRYMEELVDKGQLRMIVDAMPYYSICCNAIGQGFDIDLSLKTASPISPDLAASYSLRGRVHNRDMYAKLITRFTQESSTQYEGKYL